MKEKVVGYKRLSVDDVDRKRLRHFQAEVFGTEEVEETDCIEMMCERNVRVVRLTAVFVILVMFTIGIWDRIAGNRVGALSEGIMCALVLASGHIMIAPLRIKKCSGRRVRYAFLVYYLLFIVAVTMFTILRDMEPELDSVMDIAKGLPTISFLMALFIFTPLPLRRDNIFIGVFFVISAFIPMIPALGGQNYFLRDHLIVRVAVFLGYWYSAHERRISMEKTIALKDLSWEMIVADYMDSMTKQLNTYAMKTYWNYLCTVTPKSVGVLRCDIDNFQRYNDVCGHEKADATLYDIGQVLNQYLREKGWYLFRNEGDEFTILVPNAELEQMWEIGEELCKRVRNSNFVIPDDECKALTMTIGCAIEPMTLSHNDDYLKRADRQLEEGKKNKNSVVFLGEIRECS